jgi:hypothetical protein
VYNIPGPKVSPRSPDPDLRTIAIDTAAYDEEAFKSDVSDFIAVHHGGKEALRCMCVKGEMLCPAGGKVEVTERTLA